jgi:hypothetical protein
VNARLLLVTAALLVVALAFAGYNHSLPFDVSLAPTLPAPMSLAAGEVTDFAAFAHTIQSAGSDLRLDGDVSQPFLSVAGRLIAIDGADVQVYEYLDTASAALDAGRIARDGSTIQQLDGEIASVDWIATPHFYQRGCLIVLYVGTDSRVLSTLQSALGDPFAGDGSYNGLVAVLPLPD